MDKNANKELIELFRHCRVTDVRDGMDWMGYHSYGTMDYKIRPLNRTLKTVVGIARTARYLPFEGPQPNVIGDEYTKWASWYYQTVCTDPWMQDIEEGDFIILDVCGIDVGLLGSNNTIDALYKGAVGFVTNGGGIRDTDECIIQNVPVWSKFVSQGMDQARIRYYEKDIPVAIGGVAVYPGDVIVADGDGVIAVPRKIAYDVAKYAHQEMNADKEQRREKYEKMGWELDDTVKPINE